MFSLFLFLLVVVLNWDHVFGFLPRPSHFLDMWPQSMGWTSKPARLAGVRKDRWYSLLETPVVSVNGRFGQVRADSVRPMMFGLTRMSVLLSNGAQVVISVAPDKPFLQLDPFQWSDEHRAYVLGRHNSSGSSCGYLVHQEGEGLVGLYYPGLQLHVAVDSPFSDANNSNITETINPFHLVVHARVWHVPEMDSVKAKPPRGKLSELKIASTEKEKGDDKPKLDEKVKSSKPKLKSGVNNGADINRRSSSSSSRSSSGITLFGEKIRKPAAVKGSAKGGAAPKFRTNSLQRWSAETLIDEDFFFQPIRINQENENEKEEKKNEKEEKEKGQKGTPAPTVAPPPPTPAPTKSHIVRVRKRELLDKKKRSLVGATSLRHVRRDGEDPGPSPVWLGGLLSEPVIGTGNAAEVARAVARYEVDRMFGFSRTLKSPEYATGPSPPVEFFHFALTEGSIRCRERKLMSPYELVVDHQAGQSSKFPVILLKIGSVDYDSLF